MGGHGGNKRFMRRDFKTKKDNVWVPGKGRNNVKANDGFVTEGDKNNTDFNEYYQAQGIVPEGEWDAFLAALRKQLPVTFRITGIGKFANDFRDKLQANLFSHFSNGDILIDGEKVTAPHPLPWYPNEYAWHMEISRGQLRKLPWLEEVHEFMKKANDMGTITRQEAVSMVPPLFLDVQPHHKVLDMCAAPGSKTAQLLEALHAGEGVPSGFVVANDADAQRCNLLTHQTKRICSPCLIVTNHGAERYPGVGPKDGEPLKFDRILCDVPCSGDGTMRKAPDIWRRWNVASGNGLHCLQLKIALKACQMLKVGGRLVYSTCTFNPIEDEAVVAELLLRSQGAMTLLDVSDQLPNLKRMPGLHHWKVRDKNAWYDDWESAKVLGYKLDATMFGSEEKAKLPLERCMRILPHHQDTGGFFVAVLVKSAEMPPLESVDVSHRYRAGGEEPGAGPLEAAKAAAALAVAAAEKALAALERGADAKTAEAAVGTCTAAHEKLAFLRHASNERRREPREPRGPRGAQAAKADAEMAEADGAPETAGNGGDDDSAPVDADNAAIIADDDDEGDAMVVEDAAADEGQPAKKQKEEGGSGGEVASVAGAAIQPSWVRGGGGRNRPGGRFKGMDPILPVEDPSVKTAIQTFYGLAPDLHVTDQLITRSLESSRPKRLYFVSRATLDLVVADEQEALKITSLGLKVFERQEVREGMNSCCYRLVQEGLPFLLPYITKQKLALSLPAFLRLIRERSVPIPAVAPLEDAGAPAEAADAVPAGDEAGAAAGVKRSHDGQPIAAKSGQAQLTEPALLAQLPRTRYGCCVVTLAEADAKALGFAADSDATGALTANAPVALVAWRARASINVLVGKPECAQVDDKIAAAQARLAQAAAK